MAGILVVNMSWIRKPVQKTMQQIHETQLFYLSHGIRLKQIRAIHLNLIIAIMEVSQTGSIHVVHKAQ